MEATTKSAAAIIFEDEGLDRRTLDEARRLVFSEPRQREGLKAAAEELAEERSRARSAKKRIESSVRLGAAFWALGRAADAVEPLREAEGPLAAWLLGECLLRLGRYEEAVGAFETVEGEDAFAAAMGAAEALRLSGKPDEADKKLAPWRSERPDAADLLCQEGCLLAARGEYEAALDTLRRATEADPNHAGALFAAGYWAELRGLDEEAFAFYERCAALTPAPANALLNLGVLCEDRGDYERAESLYRTVLDSDPENARARLYLKDAQSSRVEHYEEPVRRASPHTRALLAMPVSDLEISPRSRSSLAAMNVRTLGDLVRLGEQDLLDAKDFGDASLQEIKALLESKGLQFSASTGPQQATADVLRQPSAEEQDILERPIADLELSIRSRRALESLNINTIRELTRLSEKELLHCKNFGLTSLNEISEKLNARGLMLRPGEE